MERLAKTVWPWSFWQKFFVSVDSLAKSRNIIFNNELLNYQYLFGKQSIIEKLHDKTNKLKMTSMAYISYNNNLQEF